MILIWILCILTPTIAAIVIPILFVKDNKNSIHYSLMIGLIFSFMAFAFIPIEGSTSDLVYYFTQVEFMTSVSFQNVIDFSNSRSSMIFAEFLYFLTSRMGNQHYLPAISIFFAYSITTYITIDLGKRLNVSKGKVLLVLLIIFAILPFPSLVSNVRNIMAFSISILAVYFDLVKRKRNIFTIILYALPMFLHISSLLIIILRLLLMLYKGKGKVVVIVLIMASTFSSRIFEFFLRMIPGNSQLMNEFTNKGLYYVSTNDSAYISYLQNSIFAQVEKIYFVSISVFFLLLSYSYFKKKRNTIFNSKSTTHNKNLNEFNTFFILLCIMVVSSIPVELTTYARFSWAVLITSPILLLKMNMSINFKNPISISKFTIGTLAVGGFVHQLLLFTMMSDVPETIGRMFMPTFLLLK